MNKKNKYKITFVKWNGDTWFMICTRSYFSCWKIALKHFLKRNCIAFTINKHNYEKKN